MHAHGYFYRFKLNKVQVGGGLGSKKGPNMGHKMGAKTDPKSMSKTKSKKEALEIRLGAVLGRSWADLGPPRSPKSCSRLGRGSYF